MSLRRAVFLDRDGVINKAVVRAGKPYPPDSLETFELLPGVSQAMREMRTAGWLVIVVTNQPDVASGKQRREVVDAIHQHLRDLGLVDDVKVCMHLDDDHCECRKPRPGMLLEAAQEWSIDLAGSCMVGDRWRDVGAGQAAGCRTYFIDHGYAEQQPAAPYVAVASLAAAWRLIRGS
jgi:D-glycero-D-manno-heptose 1,7-bisphosphate phosphatase